jgi:hypothetical protein
MVKMAMTYSIKILLVSLFSLCVLAGCASAQNTPNQNRQATESVSNTDLSTDEAVLGELQKRADAEREKLGLAGKGKSKLEAKNVCFERFKESAKIIVIGFFRYDYGCHFEGAFVNSRFYARDDIEMHKNALDALGWEKASKTERERLAKFWVEKGLLAFFDVLYTKNDDLKNQAFHPPQAVSDENGAVKITLWIQLPARMRREKGFQHLEFRFAEDGKFSGSSTLENLEI